MDDNTEDRVAWQDQSPLEVSIKRQGKGINDRHTLQGWDTAGTCSQHSDSNSGTSGTELSQPDNTSESSFLLAQRRINLGAGSRALFASEINCTI